MTLVYVWVLAGVLGLGMLILPALRLWHEVRTLVRVIRRVSRDLGDAREGLDAVTRDMPRRH